MGGLTKYIREDYSKFLKGEQHNPLLNVLHCAIRLELKDNLDEKKDLLKRLQERSGDALKKLIEDEGFNVDECNDTIKAITSDIEKCTECEIAELDRISIRGDKVLEHVYGDGKKLDVLTLACSAEDSQYAWILLDCKCAMKRPTYSIVCDKDNFEECVRLKFDQVIKLLQEDKEPSWKTRLIMVTQEALPILQRYINQKRIGDDHPYREGPYTLCSVGDVWKFIQRAKNQYRTATRTGKMSDYIFG